MWGAESTGKPDVPLSERHGLGHARDVSVVRSLVSLLYSASIASPVVSQEGTASLQSGKRQTECRLAW